MNTLRLPHIAPFILPKAAWIRINRLLAWSLVLSPLAHFAAGAGTGTVLLTDLALFAAHGVLSLLLFGVPHRKPRRFDPWMYLAGLNPGGLSARNHFLLGGYRIVAYLAWLVLLFFATWATLTLKLDMWPPVQALLVMSGFLGANILTMALLTSVVRHLYAGLSSALQRWRIKDDAGLALWMTTAYLVLATANLVASLFRGAA